MIRGKGIKHCKIAFNNLRLEKKKGGGTVRGKVVISRFLFQDLIKAKKKKNGEPLSCE